MMTPGWALLLLSLASASPYPLSSAAGTSTQAAAAVAAGNDGTSSVVVPPSSSPPSSMTSSVTSTAVSCVCTPSDCERVSEWECPGGGVVWDACGCCRVCARVEDEPCGGPEGFHGACAPGLCCVIEPALVRRSSSAGVVVLDARGTCKRVVPEEDGGTVSQTSSSRTDTASRWPLSSMSTTNTRRWPPKRRSRSTVGPGVQRRYLNQP